MSETWALVMAEAPGVSVWLTDVYRFRRFFDTFRRRVYFFQFRVRTLMAPQPCAVVLRFADRACPVFSPIPAGKHVIHDSPPSPEAWQ